MIAVCLTVPLDAILDGRTIPIYLESRYSFTNFEWVKGHVYFGKGFDLPVGGTVLFDSLDLVNQDISLQGGTLILKNNLRLGAKFSFNGVGFFDLNGYAIKFQTDLTLSSSEKLYIISSGALIGEGDTVISPGAGALICTPNVSSLELSVITLYNPTSANFFTSYDAPQTLLLNRSQFILSDQITFTLSSKEVQIKNLCSFLGSGTSKYVIPTKCSLIDSGKIYLTSGTAFRLNVLKGGDVSAGLMMDSASLEYTSTEAAFYLFSSSHPTQAGFATLSFQGKNRIITPVGSTAQLSAQSAMLFRPGARLKMPENSHFIIF